MKTKLACALGIAALLAVGSGCRHNSLDATLASRAFLSAPQPPPVLTTPAAMLLTNNTGFSARVNIEGTPYTGAGMLFGRNGKLLFVPDATKTDKRTPAGRYSFIWNIAKGEGIVLSDALQGWAPMSLSSLGAVADVVFEGASPAAGGALSGLKATLADGRKVQFTASQGSGGVPLQIHGGEPVFNARLAKVSLKVPDAAMFEVPRGFTAYSSPESMVDEMAARFRTLKRRSY